MNRPVKDEKKTLRSKYKMARNEMPAEDKITFDRAIYKHFINTMAYRNSKQVLLYASMEKEIDTFKIFEKCVEDNKRCFFPKCGSYNEMSFYYVGGFHDFKKGMYNIMEPINGEIYVPDHFDICIIPALSYDSYGYRLGYGKGYYDRFLTEYKGIKIGFCYNSFIEKKLPRGRFDIKVDILITEKGIYSLQNTDKNKINKNRNKIFTYQGKNK